MSTLISSSPQVRQAEAPPRGYVVAGSGTPVVMLHASLASKAQWAPLIEHLARRFRAIAIDLCGYGDNELVDAVPSFTLDEEVRLVASRLEALVEPHARAHLIGHSYGGLVALRIAHAMPDRVASLTLYDPVAFRMLDDNDPALRAMKACAEKIIELVSRGQRHEAARVFVDLWSGKGAFASFPRAIRDGIARRIDKVPDEFRAAWRWPLDFADIRAIETPTLLLAGMRSPAISKGIVKSLAAELADRRVRWLDLGHMGPVTDPQQVNPWIEAFVDARIAYDRLQTVADSPRIDGEAAKVARASPGSKERHDEHYQVL